MRMMIRQISLPRATAALLAGGLAAGLLAAPSAQAEYPERSIEVVVKAGPGSGANQLGHMVAKLAQDILGQPMAVVYKKGGSGAVAQSYIQSRPADGYTIFLDTTTTAIVLATGGSDFTEDDWRGVIRLQVDPQGVAAAADAPYDNFAELVDWIKAHPGELRWAGAHAVGTDPYTVARLLKAAGLSNSDIRYVPNDSANEMVSGLLGGHFDVAILNPAEAAEQVEAGNLKMLGVGHGERLEAYPDWPTFKEQGFDVEQAIWRGVFVPADTPEDTVKTLRQALVEMRELPEFQQFMKDQLQIDGYMGELGAFDDYFKDEVKQMREHFSESS